MTASTQAHPKGAQCQCAGCGQMFTTESNFNRHRIGEYGAPKHSPNFRRCAPPESVGLVRGPRGWHGVMTDEARERMEAIFTAARNSSADSPTNGLAKLPTNGT